MSQKHSNKFSYNLVVAVWRRRRRPFLNFFSRAERHFVRSYRAEELHFPRNALGPGEATGIIKSGHQLLGINTKSVASQDPLNAFSLLNQF